MIMLEEKDKNKNKIRNDQNLNLNMHLNRDWYKEKFNPVTMISSCLQKWKDLLKGPQNMRNGLLMKSQT